MTCLTHVRHRPLRMSGRNQRPVRRRERKILVEKLSWKKPMRCDNSSPNCVEVASGDNGERFVRDSKNPNGPVLALARTSGTRSRVVFAADSVSDAPVLGPAVEGWP